MEHKEYKSSFGSLLLLLFISICHPGMAYSQVAQPRNIMPGMTYTEYTCNLGIMQEYVRGWLVGDSIESQGEMLMPVYRIDPERGDSITSGRPRFIKTEGDKVFMLDTGAQSGKRQWLLMYDFGLKPDECAEIYYPIHPGFLSKQVRCVEIKENPKYNGLLTMKLIRVLDPEYSNLDPEYSTLDLEYSNLESDFFSTCEWIIGVGSTQGLFWPTPPDFGAGTNLEKVTLHGKEIFYRPIERFISNRRKKRANH
ncbi:MAG: hypothetical protein HDR80_07315 [Bacteroides sp.]|nr:hypothetical protein [Bacteroides sp.]